MSTHPNFSASQIDTDEKSDHSKQIQSLTYISKAKYMKLTL